MDVHSLWATDLTPQGTYMLAAVGNDYWSHRGYGVYAAVTSSNQPFFFATAPLAVNGLDTPIYLWRLSGCGNGLIEDGEECDGGVCCSALCTFVDATHVCSAADPAQGCARDVTCTGSDAGCIVTLEKRLLPAGFMCLEQPCTLTAYCDGVSPYCTPNPPFNRSVMCQLPQGVCGGQIFCDGVHRDCSGPPQYLPSSSVCRVAEDVCENQAHCTGISADCPSNTPKSKNVVCSAAQPCQYASVCDGLSFACPPPLVKDTANLCHPGFACSLSTYCNGVNATCPPTVMKAVNTTCGDPPRGVYGCATQAVCDGVHEECLLPPPLEAGTSCRVNYTGNGDVTCTLDSACDGVSRDCPVPADAGTVCGNNGSSSSSKTTLYIAIGAGAGGLAVIAAVAMWGCRRRRKSGGLLDDESINATGGHSTSDI